MLENVYSRLQKGGISPKSNNGIAPRSTATEVQY
jgi:hypothetical protein